MTATYDQYPRIVNDQLGSPTATYSGPQYVTGAGTDAVSATTKYLTYVGGSHAAAQVPLAVVIRAGYLRNLRVNLATAPAGTDTYIATVQKSVDNGANWTDTALTCTITGTAKSGSDTTHAVSLAAGDLVAVKVVATGSTGAAATATFEIG